MGFRRGRWKETAVSRGKLSGRRPTHDVVAFDDGGDALTRIAVFEPRLDADDLPRGLDQHIVTIGHLARKRQHDIELGTGADVLIDDKIEAPRRDVARSSALSFGKTMRRNTDHDRKRQVVAPGATTFRH